LAAKSCGGEFGGQWQAVALQGHAGEGAMIRGVHTMFYSSEPAALRAFLRDKLGLPCTDVGDGWLIFDLPEAEMGCHPADPRQGPPSGTHDISFYCDNIEQTVAELRARGVEFTAPVADHGYGLVTYFKVPGNFQVQLYQPRYAKKPAEK
jgi:catechol 2,3-dioxygenase-like lactoylglutathione lyase family enzyme